MAEEREIELIRARVDEHGRILDEHGQQLEGLALVVLGDGHKQIRGLLQRMREQEQLAQELQQWRHDMTTWWRATRLYLKIGIGILTLTGVGSWASFLHGFLKNVP